MGVISVRGVRGIAPEQLGPDRLNKLKDLDLTDRNTALTPRQESGDCSYCQ
jgi:hypothetical protein